MAKQQLKKYKFTPGVSTSAKIRPNAFDSLFANRDFIIAEAQEWIRQQTVAGTGSFAGYSYNEAKCLRDMGYVVDAIINDFRYGGNIDTRRISSFYWDGTTPQIDGSRQPEIDTYEYIETLINDYIIPNIEFTALQGIVDQDISGLRPPETGYAAKITELITLLNDVILNGLFALPDPVNGVGRIKVQSKVFLSDLLLITNTTTNEVIYTFNDPEKGATFTFETEQDEDFPSFLQTTDATTEFKLVYDTSHMSADDNMQIFVEKHEQKVRPYDFGTDAIERMRTAESLSMLDADFEYGLQPTKWQAIGVMRGYPSTYEIPGTDTGVVSVITDASNGTLGVGASLITVTTTAAHGFDVGTPITIKALANAITGFARAEGTFIINSIPTSTTFTYYAQAKVGETAGEVLSTTYTQLREADFYTGAAIGQPTFAVQSQGTGGNWVLPLTVSSGSTVIPLIGTDLPSIGSPILAVGIPGGAQATAVNGSGGPFEAQVDVVGDITAGDTTITVADSANLIAGLVVDNGAGEAISITTINGNDISFTGPFAVDILGNQATYTNLAGSNVDHTGAGATFDVDVQNGLLNTVSINAAGVGYTAGQKTVIYGSDTGGQSPFNDLLVNIGTVGTNGEIQTIDSIDGVVTPGNESFTFFPATPDGANDGANASFDVTVTNAAISNVVLNAGGSGYSIDNRVIIYGSSLGTTDDFFIILKITGVSAGAITTFTQESVIWDPGIADQTFTARLSDNYFGTGISFTVFQNGLAGTYTVDSGTIQNPGQNYQVGDQFTIDGALLGGASGVNDAVVTIDDTDAGNFAAQGGATTISITGTSVNNLNRNYTAVAGNTFTPIGAGATLNITRNSGVYSFLVNFDGDDYVAGDQILFTGDNLGGSTSANDALFTVTEVDTSGSIVDGTISGTAVTASAFDFLSSITIDIATTAELPATLTTIAFGSIATIELTFASDHGLVPGNTIMTTVSSLGSNHELAQGPFFVEQVPTPQTLRYTARSTGIIDTATEDLIGVVYPRPDSFFIHRPYDGGVQLGTGGPQHGAQAIRQSKKYIRYQSGKGIMYTTGAMFAPSYDISSITSNGTAAGSTITVVTDDVNHGLQVEGNVRILGAQTSGYNQDYVVESVIDERTFTVRAQTVLAATSAELGESTQMSVLTWHGATVRSGTYDDQNGIFWQYDGERLACVKRSATFQVTGTINIASEDNLVAGSGTRFRDQLASGDRVVIKGMTHVVSRIVSDTEMYVTPDYRGVIDASAAKMVKVVDQITYQEDWNRDPLDGTGPSGYDVDVAKMQMIGIQFTWYGAGFIDYMVRGSDGNFVFCHRNRNSNVNTEAFMRTGNQPVRYEVLNEGAKAKLIEGIDASQTVLTLDDASKFPTQGGVVYVDNELIAFNGITNNTLTGCTRSAPLQLFVAGSSRTFTAGAAEAHTAKTGVVLVSNTISPIISHWGSAFLTDGGFDEDRGYIFSYSETGVEASTSKQTAFLIRLAPSVSNAITGDLGERELLNRAQLLLQGLEITSDGEDGTGNKITGGIVVEGVLNPKNYPLNPNDIGWSGLSTQAQGGQPSFAQVASGGSVVWSTGAAATTASSTAYPVVSVSLITSERRQWTNRLRFTKSSFASAGGAIAIGSVPTPGFYGQGYIYPGTTVTDVDERDDEVQIRLSRDIYFRIESGVSIPFSYGENLSNRNYAFFTKASFDNAGATLGTTVTTGGGSVGFPAGTQVNSVSSFQHGSQQGYQVFFNNSFSGTLTAGSGTVEFEFVDPPYAQPGETVFSFIAVPGERSTLMLDALKELTNTTLGGRGTFPNGPDVLAINVYKVAGAPTSANVIIRWGEAQA